ncbi:outer membrane lipoprotein-sorting protein [Thermodesulforhabdus norvegica]|uniref:Uncharacterized protein TP-0789 domain-containing protein n=1 Tax=Thermodesulforhabdus norvegica TaxID=39841 RepID=A0A1I4SP88_9BACT|nr:outer membrane lipoprotein-sorting protein [Thermodesulforhabdus norvegica]SFM66150.1 hypothetical protein SAMN05660836_01079 [Thermodesulforhabdus norvegica]
MKKKGYGKGIITAFFLCILLIPFSPVFSSMAVEEIVNRANIASYYAGDDGIADAEMKIYDSQGRVRERQFRIIRKDLEDGGDQFYYVYFFEPGDVRKTVFMVHKHTDRDDDRWLYLPALDLVKRIAASDKRTSFVGSHFFYEDVSGRSPEDDRHELIEETEAHYVLKNIPKDADIVEFSSYTVWIDKNTFLPMKAEYLDKNGKLYRRMTVEDVSVIQGFPTVIKAKMEDLNSGGYTEMRFRSVKYNVNVPEDIFSERYLRRPPRQYIRR